VVGSSARLIAVDSLDLTDAVLRRWTGICWMLIDCANRDDSDEWLVLVGPSFVAVMTLPPVDDGNTPDFLETGGPSAAAESLCWESRHRSIGVADDSASYPRPRQNSEVRSSSSSQFWRGVNFLVTNLPPLICCCPPIYTHPHSAYNAASPNQHWLHCKYV